MRACSLAYVRYFYYIVPMFEAFRNYLQKHVHITGEEFDRLTRHFKRRSIPKGTVLLRPGDVCELSFFVEKGLLRSYTVDAAGKEHIIQFAPENWFLSDRSSVYFNEPSDFFIDAIEETSAISFDREFIEYASDVVKEFRAYNDRMLHKHILYMQKRLNSLLGYTAERRYMDFIRLYPDITLRVPQWMIASYLGITPESLSRVRKELAQKNFRTG